MCCATGCLALVDLKVARRQAKQDARALSWVGGHWVVDGCRPAPLPGFPDGGFTDGGSGATGMMVTVRVADSGV